MRKLDIFYVSSTSADIEVPKTHATSSTSTETRGYGGVWERIEKTKSFKNNDLYETKEKTGCFKWIFCR